MRLSCVLAMALPALVLADGLSEMLDSYTAISSTDTAAFYDWLSNYAQMAESYYSYDSGLYASEMTDATGSVDYAALASETSAAALLILELESGASETGMSAMSEMSGMSGMSGMTMSSGSTATSASSTRSSGSSGSSKATSSAASSGAASSQVSSQSSLGLGNHQAPMLIGAALAGVSILLL